MKTRLQENLAGKWENYIFPFFWQSGGPQEEIVIELEKIYACGIRAVCVEARPHPDYAGKRWWEDMDIIMDFARKHDMKVWLLDDDRFPSGHCNKAFSDGKHPLSVRFLTVHNTDVVGPKYPGYMLVKSLLVDDDELVGIVACRRRSPENNELDLESTVELTNYVKDGWLCWEVPEGLWRILVFYTTRHGNGKLDYFNIVDSNSVKVLLERVYEPHHEHYGKDFGKTFQGFFSDEPEFSNLPGYNFQARLGDNMPYIPWSSELEEQLKMRWGNAYLEKLPALWYTCGEATPHIRYEYMDAVTKQLAKSFSEQIQKWCEKHNVSHIGHIVEDDNSHGRLGCSTGHYFRSIGCMRMAGVDVVTQQIMPGMDQTEHQWVASSKDGEFFHYGLGKLASSLGHIDSKKQGDSMCEIFGAFGWQEGIGLMKWLTDHMISRGINHFTPHAFSLKSYPDPDCPPHFYAHGNQPQYRHFDCLMNYMNRLSHLFSGGKYPAKIAVLYHADAEWAGKAMLYQKPVKEMQQNQMECDVVPADLFAENNPYGAVFEADGIRVAGAHYKILLVPGCEYLPIAAAHYIVKNDMICLFVGQRPKGICEETDEEKELIEQLQKVEVVQLSELADRVREYHRPLIELTENLPKLCTYPYFGKDSNIYVFCFNEDISKTVDCQMKIRVGSEQDELVEYDALHNRLCFWKNEYKEGGFKVKLFLEPGEAKVLVIKKRGSDQISKENQYNDLKEVMELPVDTIWEIQYQNVQETSWHMLEKAKGKEFPDITKWALKRRFCGTLAYETKIMVSEEQKGDYIMRLWGDVDCADIFVNGQCTDRVIGTPMYADVILKKGINIIRLELPVTPVWKDGDPWSSLTVLPRIGLTKSPTLLR